MQYLQKRNKDIMNNYFLLIAMLLLCQLTKAQSVSQPVNISNDVTIIDARPSVAVDHNNVIHVVWAGFYYEPGAPGNTASDIYYSNNNGGSFSLPIRYTVPQDTNIVDPLWYSDKPEISVDNNNNVHIVFGRMKNQIATGGERLYYLKIMNDGTNEDPVRIASYDNPNPFSQQIFINSSGIPVVTFSNMASNTIKCVNGENWNDAVTVVNGFFIPEYRSFLDKNDKLHFVYQDESPFSFSTVIFYANNINGIPANPLQISPDSVVANSPCLTVDNDGYVHISYEAKTTIDLYFLPYNAWYVNNKSGNFNDIQGIDENVNAPLNLFTNNADEVYIFFKNEFGIKGNGSFIFSDIIPLDQYVNDPDICFSNNDLILYCYWWWLGDEYASDAEIYCITVSGSVTSIEKQIQASSESVILYQNYPNPFSENTKINYYLPVTTYIELSITDVDGSYKKILDQGKKSAGNYSTDFYSESLPDGIYFISLKTNKSNKTIKSLLMK